MENQVDPATRLQTVILLDDESKFLVVAQKLLRDKGYNLITCRTPEEALERVQFKGPIAVVVADYQMPSMKGTEMFAQMKILSPLTVRVLITAHGYEADIMADAVNEGEIFRFIKKPIDFSLADKIIQESLAQYQKNILAQDFEKTLSAYTTKHERLQSDARRMASAVARQKIHKRRWAILFAVLVLCASAGLAYQSVHELYHLEITKKKFGSWVKYINDTAVDTHTGLMWMTRDFRLIEKRPPESWDEAVAWVARVNNQKLAGHADWRLPSVDELEDTYQENSGRVAYDNNEERFVGYPAAFENGGGFGYWSADALGKNSAKFYFFLGGYQKAENKKYSNPAMSARLVRGP